MANKWDITTVVQSLTGSVGGTSLGLAAVVPQGKKRFVTYIKIQCRSAANVVNLGGAADSVGALSTTYFTQLVNSTYEYPEEPGDTNHPIFAIDATEYLGAVTGNAAVSGTMLTLQYYDE